MGDLVLVGIGVVWGVVVGRRVGYSLERERCFVVGNEFGVGLVWKLVDLVGVGVGCVVGVVGDRVVGVGLGE